MRYRPRWSGIVSARILGDHEPGKHEPPFFFGSSRDGLVVGYSMDKVQAPRHSAVYLGPANDYYALARDRDKWVIRRF